MWGTPATGKVHFPKIAEPGVNNPNAAFPSADYADCADVVGRAPFADGTKPCADYWARISINLRNLRNLRTTLAAFG